MAEYPELIPKHNMMDFISNDGGKEYNLCHFWSNFEIADLKFLRGPEYSAYFDYLDKSGGFFYERWGDAPVHSIAVGLFLNKSEVHFFDDIGYKHDPFMHCPISRELQKKCHCNAEENFGKNVILLFYLSNLFLLDWTPNSCMHKWNDIRF
jgi:alpha 1,2-mannosyltransferase